MKKHASKSNRKIKVVKKRVPYKGPHANMSFSQMVTGVIQKKMSEFVNGEIKNQFGVVMDQLRSALQSRIDLALGSVNIRMQAIEESLYKAFPGQITEDMIDASTVEVENTLLNLVPVTDAIQDGDYVRITMSTEDSPEPQRFSFPNINTEPYQIESLEKALIGLTVGDVKELSFELYNTPVTGNIRIVSVSRKMLTEKKEPKTKAKKKSTKKKAKKDEQKQG